MTSPQGPGTPPQPPGFLQRVGGGLSAAASMFEEGASLSESLGKLSTSLAGASATFAATEAAGLFTGVSSAIGFVADSGAAEFAGRVIADTSAVLAIPKDIKNLVAACTSDQGVVNSRQRAAGIFTASSKLLSHSSVALASASVLIPPAAPVMLGIAALMGVAGVVAGAVGAGIRLVDGAHAAAASISGSPAGSGTSGQGAAGGGSSLQQIKANLDRLARELRTVGTSLDQVRRSTLLPLMAKVSAELAGSSTGVPAQLNGQIAHVGQSLERAVVDLAQTTTRLDQYRNSM